MKLLISEVLQKSNAKTKARKIELSQHNTDALRMLLIWNFDDSVVSELPAGEVPYEKNEATVGTEHTVLEKEARLLYNFVQGGNNDSSSPDVKTCSFNAEGFIRTRQMFSVW